MSSGVVIMVIFNVQSQPLVFKITLVLELIFFFLRKTGLQHV